MGSPWQQRWFPLASNGGKFVATGTGSRMNASLSCLCAAYTDDFERYQSFGRSLLHCSLGGTSSWIVAFIYVQPGKRIFIPRFLKKGWRSNDFWLGTHGIGCSNGLLFRWSRHASAGHRTWPSSASSSFLHLEIYHAPPLDRINCSTAFAPFSNGRAAAIIIIQNSTASQAKCRGASFVK